MYSVVETKEKNRLVVTAVPTNWVIGDCLIWPGQVKNKVELNNLLRNENSVPGIEWVPQKCSVRASKIESYSLALTVEKAFLHCHDTDDEQVMLKEIIKNPKPSLEASVLNQKLKKMFETEKEKTVDEELGNKPLVIASRSDENDNKTPVQHSNKDEQLIRLLSPNIIKNITEAHQSTDLLEDCQKLLEKFNHPWEMMPLMYAILKDARADLEEASRRIEEDRGAETLLDLCQRLKEKFQLPWKMLSLVNVVLKYAKQNPEEAYRQIESAFLDIRAIAAVEAARYTYHIPYTGLYTSAAAAAAALYPPVYLHPSIPLYHQNATTILPPTVPPNCSSPPSPHNLSRPLRPPSRSG